MQRWRSAVTFHRQDLWAACAARLHAQAKQGLQGVVAKNETAIIYQVEFANKLQEEQTKERARLEQIVADARAEGNIAKLGRLMLRIMNPKHPHYSVRLHAGIKMWAHFEETDLTNASPYDALNAWALDNAETLGLIHNTTAKKAKPLLHAALMLLIRTTSAARRSRKPRLAGPIYGKSKRKIP